MAGLALDVVRRAKATMRDRLHGAAWYRGCGVAPAADSGYVLRLSVAPGAPEAEVPREWEGVPVEVVEIDEYAPREAGGESAPGSAGRVAHRWLAARKRPRGRDFDDVNNDPDLRPDLSHKRDIRDIEQDPDLQTDPSHVRDVRDVEQDPDLEPE